MRKSPSPFRPPLPDRRGKGGNAPRHPAAWCAWLAAAALPALSTRNPLYLSLTLLAAGVTYLALGRRNPAAGSWSVFVRFGALLWLLTVPFTALTAHYGRLVLFRLPASWPVVGGPVTGEALLYGLTGGLALIALLLIFAAFNLAVDQARLLRMTPGFLYQAGVVTAIAVAFVPQMVASWQAIREAQQARGHRVRGVRDLLPLLLPLLVTALERAMQLAESMEARGFGGRPLRASAGGQRTGRGAPPGSTNRAGVAGDDGAREGLAGQAAILGGLGALGVGAAGLGFWPERGLMNGLLLGGGGLAFAWAFWVLGRRVRRTRYRRWTWEPADRGMLAAGAAAALGWTAVVLLRSDWLLYYPYPPGSPWPTFNPLLGLLILLSAAPGMLLREA